MKRTALIQRFSGLQAKLQLNYFILIQQGYFEQKELQSTIESLNLAKQFFLNVDDAFFDDVAAVAESNKGKSIKLPF